MFNFLKALLQSSQDFVDLECVLASPEVSLWFTNSSLVESIIQVCNKISEGIISLEVRIICWLIYVALCKYDKQIKDTNIFSVDNIVIKAANIIPLVPSYLLRAQIGLFYPLITCLTRGTFSFWLKLKSIKFVLIMRVTILPIVWAFWAFISFRKWLPRSLQQDSSSTAE